VVPQKPDSRQKADRQTEKKKGESSYRRNASNKNRAEEKKIAHISITFSPLPSPLGEEEEEEDNHVSSV
jgi:hypothetical protein